MKMVCFGVDISDNDVSCSDELIKSIKDNLYKIEKMGAKFAKLTNITGDDVVITAVVEDDEKLEDVNYAIYHMLCECALGFEDLNGVGKTPQDAGEGISYTSIDINNAYLPDAVIVAFDTYCGESFVDDVAKQALDAARGIRSVGDSAMSVIDGKIKEIPGVGYVSSQTDDPVVVVAVEDVHQVGVVAGAMMGAILGYKNTYLTNHHTPAKVIPGSVIFTVTALLNSNVIDLSDIFNHRMQIL